ncbi:pescadillo homolog [Saccoglossus kowalevskii]|uniref:Pescadillo homolog n=1 Tax=Saccoglossus kowalevskii TaxID=10224 RepID=A0ABM0MFU7_SACKO|nr:PREDICTED: pescadillo homolog [Saccoglossus kowalevskii]
MCFLFATFPRSRAVHVELIELCRRLTIEFMHYVIVARALRKVFISIKGIYYQVEIQGQKVTWLVPHHFAYTKPKDVDFKVMATFIEFYNTLLGFVNFRMYHSINLHYPPKLTISEGLGQGDSAYCLGTEVTEQRLAALSQTLAAVAKDTGEDEVQGDEFPAGGSDDPEMIEKAKEEEEKLKALKNLFSNCKFFLSREVPRESLTFIIRCFGGLVSWDKIICMGATYEEKDESITHQIVDRPNQEKQYLSRYYLQPQWVFDSVNAGTLLPVEDYFVGTLLPPHLSPFVEEKEGEYVPPEKQALSAKHKQDEEQEEEAMMEDSVKVKKPKKRKRKMKVEAGKVELEDENRIKENDQKEERKLAEMMIPKKRKRLYNKIMYKKKMEAKEARKLAEKRKQYDQEVRSQKKKLKA